MRKNPISIAILAYPGAQMSAVLGLCDLISIANRYGTKYSATELGVVQISTQEIDKTKPHDAIIVPPSLSQTRGENEKDVHDWLRSQHAAGALMCSVCAGAFWLGHSGLLNGRPVTTHWALEDEFSSKFPDTQLVTEHLLIDDNDIVTAGGLMAWLDLGLFLVNRWLGPQIVSDTARHMLIDPGGREQRNYRSFNLPLAHGDRGILKIQHWLESNLETEITIKVMAERAQLSVRTFLRRFKTATGYTPNAYIQSLRIEKARGLLERTKLSVNEICWKVGYSDPSAFSRLFRSTIGLTAGEYRNRFKVRQ